MRNFLMIGSVLTVIGLLMALTIPALAHGSGNGTTNTTSGQTWEDMYDACQSGDWEAMEEAARQVHGEGYDNMPYHEGYNGSTSEDNETSGNGWSGMGDHMGDGWGGMMGGGMMGW